MNLTEARKLVERMMSLDNRIGRLPFEKLPKKYKEAQALVLATIRRKRK